MTWRLPVLPLAPRPLPGEGVLSWVRRVAARYDLGALGFVSLLYPPEVRVPRSRVAALDWTGEAGLDQALAAAGRLDPERIAALRPIPDDKIQARLLRRDRTVWCDLCVRDDMARHGEAYERGAWRLGWCVACPVHGCRLDEACPSCLMGGCSFRAVAGRVRLVCGICRGPVDAVPPARDWRAFEKIAATSAALVAPNVSVPVLALQEALLAASKGAAPTGPLGFGLDAEAFLSFAHSLTALITWPLRSRPDVAAASDQDLCTPGALPVAGLHRCFRALAAVLAEATGTAGPAHAAAPATGESEAAGEFAPLLGCCFGRNREEWRRRAQTWGPVLGPLVLGVLDEQDERARQHAEIAERARQEAMQARRQAAELRRIRARRTRRAALARLRRKYEKRRVKK